MTLPLGTARPITHTVSHFCECLIYDDSPLLWGEPETDRRLGALVRLLFEERCGVVVLAQTVEIEDDDG